VSKDITKEGLDFTPGSRWDPKASTLAPWLTRIYQPLFPVFQDLNVALVSTMLMFIFPDITRLFNFRNISFGVGSACH
jgi:hypothetical protein